MLTKEEFMEFRREDHTIDLKKLFGATHCMGTLTMAQWGVVIGYFREIEMVQRINSKQLAAVVMAEARRRLRGECR